LEFFLLRRFAGEEDEFPVFREVRVRPRSRTIGCSFVGRDRPGKGFSDFRWPVENLEKCRLDNLLDIFLGL